MTLEIRLARDADVANITSFNPVNPGELNFEFFHGDESENSCFYIVEDTYTREIVATQGYISYPMYKNGKEVLTARSERTLVDQRLRGGGWFQKMVSCCDDFSKKNFSEITWGNTSALKAFSKAGFGVYSGFRTYCILDYTNGIDARLRAVFNVLNLKKIRQLINSVLVRNKSLNDAKIIMTYLALARVTIHLKRKIPRHSEGLKLECQEFENIPFDRINGINSRRSMIDDAYYIKYTKWLIRYIGDRYKHKKRVYVLRNGNLDVAYFVIGENTEQGLLEIIDFGAESHLSFDAGLRRVADEYKKNGIAMFWVAFNVDAKLQSEIFDDIRKRLLVRKSSVGSFVIKSAEEKCQIGQVHVTDVWNII
jgi:hypothetical protein